jgi:hypothetical protein
MTTELLTPKKPSTGSDLFPFRLMAARADRPLRIPAPVLPARLLMRGDRHYLRALRAAEMKAWQASGGDAFRPGPVG